MTKKIILFLLVLTSLKCLGQSKVNNYFYVFVQEDETNWWCSTDLKYETLLLQTDNYKARDLIAKNKIKELKTNPKYDIRSYDFTLTKSDYIVIYEQIMSYGESSNCKENCRTIKAFKTNNPTKIDAILKQEINTSYTKERTVSYKIIETLTPAVYDGEEEDLLNQLLGNIRLLINNYKKDKELTKEEKEKIIQEINKNHSSIGVRG